MRLQPSQKPTRSGRDGKYRFRIVVFVLVVALGSGLSSTGANPQTFVTLANFNGTDGQNPDPKTLVLAPDGNFYGTAQSGGANGSGTFFRITPAGDLISLYDFCSLPDCEDGGGPVGGLLLGSDGNLYGLASFGGTNGVGTAFRFTTLGSFTLLNSLSPATGSFPFARLAEGPDGNFSMAPHGTVAWLTQEPFLA